MASKAKKIPKGTILLPLGHEWNEQDSSFLQASEHKWECSRCRAVFFHDMMDNSTHYYDGDGACEEDCEEEVP